VRAVGLGCMRLSTEPDRDDARARDVIRAALDAGVTLLDTADAYAHDASEVGHNERLIAEVVGQRAVRIVTKGGLVRPHGQWIPDGRAKHLDEAARASRERLGRIDVYLLHAVDPQVPLATSVRALAKLREAGVVGAIGLSNINVHQLEQALAIAPIEAVEVELHPWRLDALRGGLVAACERRGIELLAHRPLGGKAFAKRVARDKELVAIAARLGATPAEVILAWLRSLSPMIVPLPGATRVETARSAARIVELDADARAALQARFVSLGAEPAATNGAHAGTREVVMIAGMPGAGKTTLAADLAARGHVRLNRDDRGGTLIELARELDRALAAGSESIVLDNTYGTRASRAPVIEIANKHGIPVRCIVLATTLEQAQTNAAARILERYGRLPADMRGEILPSALFRYRRTYEPPRLDEGFASIDEIAFERASASGGRPALVVELDGLVWQGLARDPARVELRPGAAESLAAWAAAGYALAGTLWRPGMSADVATELGERVGELIGARFEVALCPHPAGPPKCWCRKPLPGMGLVLARRLRLDLARSVHAGKGPADRGFASRLGMRYVDGLAPPPAT
jgi:aryl-alcohol dehydrogenase-like predicted oxidoreductase